MERYDVVIIGAGPAGLNCAYALKDSEKSVLILEKNPDIGPKVCAGSLTKHDLDFINLPQNLIEKSFNEVLIHTPFITDRVVQDKPFVFTIDRKELGQWMAKRLDNSNIKIRTQANVTKITGAHIVINNSEEIGYHYLVGADGSCSIVRRHLGLPFRDEDIALQYLVKTTKFKKFEIFMDAKRFHCWYAWVFPHKDYASIGCGCDPRYLAPDKLKKNFSEWLTEQNIDISKAKYQAFPINFDYKGYEFGKIFLAGDAAGLASGLTGEGIYQALCSGEAIGKMLRDRNHHSLIIDELIRTKRMHDKILTMLEESGPLRSIEYELLGLILKSKLIDRTIIKSLI